LFAYLISNRYIYLIGPIVTLIFTFISIRLQNKKLPSDGGRAFAVDGASAKGKPTSAGIIFISCLFVGVGLFSEVTWEYALLYLCAMLAMVCGYLDDKNPWSATKKGLTDVVIALASGTLASFIFPRTVDIFILDLSFSIPQPLYIFLAACLVWASINFTNASDGVDGLCGNLTMVSTVTYFVMTIMTKRVSMMNNVMLYLCVVLIVYLWYNCHPSTMLMGDSGSQAIGVFLAFFAMASGNPFSYLIICLPMVLDGGSSLFKLLVCRVTKKKFMSKIRTPLHDHCRKEWSWANQMVTERFTLIHLMIEGAYLLILYFSL
jgi:phospho-N-acetylmuramoyl-pentapeptide-transferase